MPQTPPQGGGFPATPTQQPAHHQAPSAQPPNVQSQEGQNIGAQNMGTKKLGVQNMEAQNLETQNLGPQNPQTQHQGDQNQGISSAPPPQLVSRHISPHAEHRPMRLNGPRPTKPQGPLLPHVKTVIAVASGKGGVGKSSTAVNLAVALGMEGLKTGLMDADVYGPSVAHMLGLHTKPEAKAGILQPIEAWGVKAMSIGLLVNPDEALVWRGPMVMGAITQFLGDVNWGALDVLVIDMPPGTGDAQLTLAQKIQLGGAVIVSTPQDIALIDARRAIRMFEKTNVPILGVIENMAYFTCPHCGENSELFGHGGARQEAEKQDVPFLGEIPLVVEIRSHADAGTPLVAKAPDSPAGQAYRRIARQLAASLTQTVRPSR
ncbi:P-loop NTPase [Entomobacter blattae]